MLSEREAIYELWEEEPPVFPPHSRLYHLEPVGVGSPMVESLTSYLTRLAEAHSVYLRTLIRKEILPHLHQQGFPLSDHLSAFWMDSCILNGVAGSVSVWVQVLEQLTLRQDLRFLTMLTFEEVLSQRNLVRRTRAWCPMCYEQWQESNQIVYDPLLWAFEILAMCPNHGILLHQRCPNPHCARTLYPLNPRSQSGFCSWCGWWLGVKPKNEEKRTMQDDSEWKWQQQVGHIIGELLAAAPNLDSPPVRDCIVTTASKCVELAADENVSAFARRVHLSLQTVWKWLQGKTILQIAALVQVCAHLEISPICWLTGNLTGDMITQRRLSWGNKIPVKSQKTPRAPDEEQLKYALETIMQSEESPPPSMREVGRRLGYDPAYLSPRFPDYCRAISKRYLDYQAARRAERIQKICDEVRGAAYNLHAQGYYPSDMRIRKVIKTRGAFKEREVRDVWQDTLRELGWKQ